MRTYNKAGIVFIVGVVILMSAIVASSLVDSPKDIGKRGAREYWIARSGLPQPIRGVLVTLAVLLFFSALAMSHFVEKWDKAIAFERDVVRLKRICRMYRYSLIICSVIFASLFIFAIAGLLTVRRIGFAHVAHSRAFGDLGITLVCISMLLYYRDYLRSVTRAPVAPILAAKLKMKALKQEYDLLPEKFSKDEIASLPLSRIPPALDYQRLRNSAIGEPKPAFCTLAAMLLAALVKHDRHLVDLAAKLTKENVPEDAYLYLIGSSLCWLGFQEEGFAMLGKVVELDPSPSSVAMLACYAQDIEEERILANKVLSDDPDNPSALLTLAASRYHANEIDEAERILNKILEIEPDDCGALEMKGDISFDRGEYRDAFAFYRKIKARPLPISLQFKMCQCYYSLGMIKEARRIARKIEGQIASAYGIDIEGGVEAARSLLTEILNS